MNALEIRGLRARCGDFTLGSLDLTLPCGCVMGLVGENGAGKSTTFRLILDMLRRDAGEIRLFGRDNLEAFPAVKAEIGWVPDEPGLPGCMTAERLGRVFSGIFRNWDADAYAGYLRQLELPRRKKFREFSRGMRMKLGIAAALSHRPRLLLLDEPTGGLDPVARDAVVDLLSDFTRSEEHAILISSHIVSDLEKLCDYMAFLHRGKLLLCEEKDRLRERWGVLRCTPEELARIAPDAVRGKRVTAYGVEALVERAAVPRDTVLGTADLEELFVLMAKEAG